MPSTPKPREESCSMATRQVKRPSKKPAPAARQARTGTKRAEPARVARKTPARSASAKPKAARSAPKPASMTGPLPSIVTLGHLAEWAGYNYDVPRKQAIAMFNGLVEDIGRVLKQGSRIRIPNLGILQVRIRPARPARKGRNPATGEEILIKASKASKRVAFRVAKALKEAI